MSNAFTPLDDWYRIAKTARWKHLDEVRRNFSSAEAVGNFTVFNIKGNNYRLIVSIDYESQIIYVKPMLYPIQNTIRRSGKMTTTIDKDTYGSLLVEFQPKVITTEEENERVLTIVEKLMAVKDRTPEQNAF